LKCNVLFCSYLYILAGSNHQGPIDVKSCSLVSKKQETIGSSLFTSSDKKSLNTKQVNVSPPLTVASSVPLTGNTKSATSFSFSTVNSVGKESSASVSSSQSSSISGFGNSQLGKGGLHSAQSVGALGGSQNSTKDGGGISFKSSLFTSSGSDPAKIGERNEAGFGGHSQHTSYTTDRKVFGSSVGLSSEQTLSVAQAKASPVGSSSSGLMTGSSGTLQSLRGSPLSQQPAGKSYNSRTSTALDNSRNSKMGTMFDSEQDLSKKFYSVRSIEHVKLLFYSCAFL
jgi:nuclear pore complex protein Nup214